MKNEPTVSRPVRIVVIGAGNRANKYLEYARRYPDQLQPVAVVDVNDLRRHAFARDFGLPACRSYAHYDDFFADGVEADMVLISTPENVHFDPAVKAIDAGYHILLEKPIAQTFDECRRLVAHARDKKKIVCLTHVLRYSPYFLKLKEMIDTKRIGDLVSIQHFEPVDHIHMSHSYVRGSWHDSVKSTPLVLAKSSHDLDILYWMIGKPCRRIAAFGGLKHFKSENAPKGSTERCTDGCAAEATCPFSALKIYYRDRTWLYVFDLPEEEPERGEAILRYLRTTDYGRCVYRCSNDQPDHYVTSMEFEGGVTVNFSIEAFTSYMGRRTRIMGTRGDIVGDMESFTLTDFATGEKTVYDANAIDAENYKGAGHGGGDAGMIRDWIEAVRRQDATIMSTPLDDSLESHAIAFAAERSRKEGRIVELG